MDPMFIIPKDRKKLSVVKLCLLMGVTALLYLVIADSFGVVARAVLQVQP